MNAGHRPATGRNRIDDGTDEVATRIAGAAWSIAALQDGAEFRLILRGPVDAATSDTVLARLDDVLAAGQRVVTIDVAGLWATHDQVAVLLGEAQCRAADRSGLVVAVGVRPDAEATPCTRSHEG